MCCLRVFVIVLVTSCSRVKVTSAAWGSGPEEGVELRSSWPYRKVQVGKARNEPEATLRFGHHNFQQIAEESFDRVKHLEYFENSNVEEESGFSTAEVINELARAYEDGREDMGIKRNAVVARELHLMAARLGHPASQHALALAYASEGGGDNEAKAILHEYFSALGGDPLAHAVLGYRFLYGYGTPVDCEQSLAHYEVAARAVMEELHLPLRGGTSYPIERTRLSDRFAVGRRPASDSDAELVQYWHIAAELGEVQALKMVGVLHQSGQRGATQDLPTALSFYLQAAKAGDVGAAARAGDMLMRGAGAPPDYKAAHALLLQGKDDPIGINGLGYLYLYGLGVQEDIVKAWAYFEKALEMGQPLTDALYNLGELFLDQRLDSPLDSETGTPHGVRGNVGGKDVVLVRSPHNALGYLMNAASHGHIQAAFRAGQIYSQGFQMTRPNCANAVRYFKEVMDGGPWVQGMSEALHLVVRGDYNGALNLYTRLAEMGNEIAQSNAAWLIERGHCGDWAASQGEEGCEKRALRMYERAARQGRSEAFLKVGDFHYYGKAGLLKDPMMAARRYLKAAEGRVPEANFNLGYMHQEGLGVPHDLHMAKRFYDTAAQLSSDAEVPVRLALMWLKCLFIWEGFSDRWEASGMKEIMRRVKETLWGGQRSREPGGSQGSDVLPTQWSVTLDTKLLLLLLGLLVVVLRMRTQRARLQRALRRQ